MPVSFLGDPKVQYLDANGDPLSGGKLYSYEPGTTTNKATYPTIADAKAQTNANANPVILDSRGEADVVLGGKTKLVLTDSADVTIWTLDNVNGDSDFLDSNGDELIVFSEATNPVNHLQLANAATGTAPKLSSVGDDTNIALELESKGSGNIVLDPGSSGDVVIEAGSLVIPSGEGINDAGGDEYLTFTESTTPVNHLNITSSDSGVRPSLSSTGDEANVGMIIDTKAAGTLTLGSQDMKVETDSDTVDLQTGGSSRLDLNDSGMRLGGANTRVSSILDEDSLTSNSATALATQQSIKAYVDGRGASQAEMESASSTTKYATPANVEHAIGVAKVLGRVAVSGGTPTLSGGVNITSITDNGVGLFQVNIDTDFSGTYMPQITQNMDNSANAGFWQTYGLNSGDFDVATYNTAVLVDPTHFYVTCFGDQ